ncbi:MAG: family 43 glycosylhydrolase [Clostridiales bacterium]|jgi:hypothetical protein|nr:family 43 glycosylhydrolase [Clostridiales bacterium]
MKKDKLLVFGVLIVFLFNVLLACSPTQDNGNGDQDGYGKDFEYYSSVLSKGDDINYNLFFQNLLDFKIADPSLLYIEEGEERGYFYVYGTSYGLDGATTFESWRSKDLSNWENMGVAYKGDYTDGWASRNHWAPEVIYDKTDKLYYLFYSSTYSYGTGKDGWHHMSVAVSDKPQGPFFTPVGVQTANGNVLSVGKPAFDMSPNNPKVNKSIAKNQTIDASPFLDPVTGKKYLYFSYLDTFSKTEIYGIEMTDWFSPKYETLKRLTAMGYLTVDAADRNDFDMRRAEGNINEGPFMYYHDGVYYLTLSIYGYQSVNYQVVQALSDSPLGDFEKIRAEDHGTIIAASSWDHVMTAGHHSFFHCGDELFIAYHTFRNADVSDTTVGRGLAVDKIEFITDAEGRRLMHANGPTKSLQPLPEEVSGYKNIAESAQITANNTAEGSDTRYLNDGLIKFRDQNKVTEYAAKAGNNTVITLEWDSFKTARAILIYNSYEYYRTFVEIEKIEIRYQAQGKAETAVIGNLDFDWDWHCNLDAMFMRPGGASIAEFDELPIDRIDITIRPSSEDDDICISEIVVLGKDAPVAPVKGFKKYGFAIDPKPSPVMFTQSANFGSPAPSINSTNGYNVLNDGTDATAYVTQDYPADQYLFFKDVYAESFYIEAEFTVNYKKPFENDALPKFGLMLHTGTTRVISFVCADTGTPNRIGCAYRGVGGSSWSWTPATHGTDLLALSYRDGNYIQLGMLRVGPTIYTFVNGQCVLKRDDITGLGDTEAGTGFVTLNIGVKIKNYSASSDPGVIASKLALCD